MHLTNAVDMKWPHRCVDRKWSGPWGEEEEEEEEDEEEEEELYSPLGICFTITPLPTTLCVVHIQIGANKHVCGKCRVECSWSPQNSARCHIILNPGFGL